MKTHKYSNITHQKCPDNNARTGQQHCLKEAPFYIDNDNNDDDDKDNDNDNDDDNDNDNDNDNDDDNDNNNDNDCTKQ